MNENEIRALLSVALQAALADGAKDPREQEELKALVGRLGEGRIDLTDVYGDVLVRRVPLADVVRPLTGPLRQQAYETAVAMAAADGVHTPAEASFLRALASALGIAAPAADQALAEANAVAGASDVPAASGAEPARALPAHVLPDPAALDKRILDASITNAALELLPETLASMAILPLQMRLVYQIGRDYGYELDQGHIKEFVATLGMGLTGQYLEQLGRRLLGGVLGGVLGGMGRMVGRQAARSGMAFATTWAIGQVARKYYAGGRTLDTASLKAAFASLLSEGQGLLGTYSEQIRRRAGGIDVRNLPALVGRS